MKTIIPVCAATLVAFPLLAMTADELAESSSVSIVLGGSTTAAPSTLRSMLAVNHDDHDHGDELQAVEEEITVVDTSTDVGDSVLNKGVGAMRTQTGIEFTY